MRRIEFAPGVAGEASQQRPQIVAPALAEEREQAGKLVGRQGRSLIEARVGAILAGQDGERDGPFARHLRERLDAVAPPIEPAEQPDHDHLGVAADRVDPQIDRHRVTQFAQMRQPQARQPVLLRRVSRSETGKIAIGERQDHDLARRLAEIDRLDHVVETDGACLKEMHGYSSSALATASRSRPLRPITTRFPCRRSDAAQGRS